MGAADRDLTAGEIRFLKEHGGLPAEVWSEDQPAVETHRSADIAARADYADTLTVDDGAARLGVDPALISQWLAQGQVAGWAFGAQVRLPEWQFMPGGLLPHLAEVLAVLPADLSPATVRGFVTTRHDDLEGKTVIDWLVGGGDVAAVAFAATGLDSW